MIKLYSENDLNILKKKKNTNMGIFISLLCVFVITLTLLIIFASYKLRRPFEIITSIVCVVEIIVSIFFISKFNFYRSIYNEYFTLLNTEIKERYLTFSDISIKPITLQDKSKVYEVKFTNKDNYVVLYLSYIFDNDIFTLNHRYKIQTCFDYIVGYEDEN